MKPCRVTMQAFGPYLQKTEIDFTALYPYGIFLITGPTGCGKTTILDAICYALYGRASGSLRDARDMRSASVPDSVKTAVSFEMALGPDRYKFERVMAIRTVKRRSGETERVTDYEESCFYEDGGAWRLICTGPQVRDKAVELLGFSHEQFSQVVVLPQGEFRRLLTAPSIEKQKILETLFGTARWQVFSKTLSQRAKAIDAELSGCLERAAALCASVQCEGAEAVTEQQSKAAEQLKALEEGQKALVAAFNTASSALLEADTVEKRFAEYDAVREKLRQLAEQEQKMAQKRDALELAEKALTVAPYLDTVKKAEKAVETANAGAQAAKLAHEAAEAADRQTAARLASFAEGAALLKTLVGDTARLEGALAPARALKEAGAALAARVIAQKAACKSAEEAAARLEKQTAASETLKKRIGELEAQFVVRLPELVAQKAAFSQRAEMFGMLEAQKKATATLSAALGEKRVEYKELAMTLKHEKQIAEKMQRALEGDAAFMLAGELQNGSPCPVCGSTEHPRPAPAVAGVPSKDELETQKRIVARLEEGQKRSGEEGARVRGEYDAAQKRLAELEKDCEKAGSTKEETAAQFAATTRALAEAEAAAKEKQALGLQQRAAEDALLKAREDADRQKAAVDEAALAVSTLEGRLCQLTEAVPEEQRDLPALEAQITAIKNRYEALAQGMKAAETAAAEAHTALAGTKERLLAANEAQTVAEKACAAAKGDCRQSLLRAGLAQDTPVHSLLIDSQLIDREVRDAIHAELDGYARESYLQKERATALEAQLADLRRPDIAALREREAISRGAMEQALAQKGSIEAVVKNLNGLLVQLAETAAREDKLRHAYALYDHVFRLTGGDNPLKTPIQQFVLGLMLDDIVASANAHLLELSRGRYTLVHSAQPARGGGTKGLDLSVGDAWSGGERGVNTLSGGELFLASLSLAFGLSDVVQAYAGGIRLDSLFIDEGFGTLDAETLDTAMGALERLRLSGRLVGVISHVDELGERIPAHIEVNRAGGATQAFATQAPGAQASETQASATAIVRTP